MSKKNENINEEVKNAEETAEDIKDTETKEEDNVKQNGTRFNWSIKRTSGSILWSSEYACSHKLSDHTSSITSSIDRQHRNGQKSSSDHK